MNTKHFQTFFCIGAMLSFSAILHATPSRNKTWKTIRLSSSASLIVERVKESAAPPKGTPDPLAPGVSVDPSSPLGRSVNITYKLIFKQGKKEVTVDQFEFRGMPDFPGGLGQAGFGLYDAALDGENLLCVFVYKYQMFLATAHVDQSGNISGYHRGTMLGKVGEKIEDASFKKDKDGKVTLKTKEPVGWQAFQFSRNGEAFGVPVEED